MSKISKITVDGVTYDVQDAELTEIVNELKDKVEAGGGSVAEVLEYKTIADTIYVAGRGTVKGSSIVIPDYYEGKPVRGLLDTAFNGDTEITSFTLGNYITFVPEEVIAGMPNLQELYWNGQCTPKFVDVYYKGYDWDYNTSLRWFVGNQGGELEVYTIGDIYNGEVTHDAGPSGNMLPKYRQVCTYVDMYNEEFPDSPISYDLVVDSDPA